MVLVAIVPKLQLPGSLSRTACLAWAGLGIRRWFRLAPCHEVRVPHHSPAQFAKLAGGILQFCDHRRFSLAVST